jgi:6-phosphogluconolactonase
MPDIHNLQVFPNEDALAAHAASLFAQTARDAIAARGRFTVALTGGSSPKKTCERLAQAPLLAQINWANVFVFLGDERFVPYNDERSNYGMCRSLLLGHVPLAPNQVFPIPTDTATPREAALAYAETLSRVFARPSDGPPPALDLILLGMGDDGHCASLFPGMPTLHVTDRWVISSPPGTLPPPVDRVTCTFPILNAARQVVFLVTGEKKAAPVRDIFEGGAGLDQHPAAGVNPASGTLTWLLDEAAASGLKNR